MMICDKCGAEQLMTLDTRAGVNGTIMRRRQCKTCQHKFITYEMHSVAAVHVRGRFGEDVVRRMKNKIALHWRDVTIAKDLRTSGQVFLADKFHMRTESIRRAAARGRAMLKAMKHDI